MVKCNVDAAVFSSRFKVGYGGVVRDNSGSFVAGVQGIILGRFAPLMVEAIRFREALNGLKSIHISKVIMEGDSV
ncbi:hypothetical protein LguiA_014651 [Lonicera macranthoides]